MKVVNKEGVEFVVGERYNFKYQEERLIYMGTQSYPGNGTWHQFALVEKPYECWSEARDMDLHLYERTKDEVVESKTDQPTDVDVVNDALLGMVSAADLSRTASGLLAIKSMDGQKPTTAQPDQSTTTSDADAAVLAGLAALDTGLAKHTDGQNPINSLLDELTTVGESADTELVTLRLPAAVIAAFTEVATELGIDDYQVIIQRVLINHCENHLVK